MNGHYFCGAAKVFDTEQIVLVKTEKGFIEAGDIVEIITDGNCHMANVLCTSYIRRDSADESVMLAHTQIYDVEKVFRKTWENKEEESEDGQSV